ncbi:MAG: hypothetical protein ACKVT2_14420 [Saprospiraceae bacterium]
MSELSVKEAINNFYQRNDFGDDGGLGQSVNWVKIGFLPLPIFNLPSRKKALRIHDIHHVVMGFDTSWKGETAVSAWEIGSGGWGRLWYVWLIVLSGMAGGVVLYPKSTKAAFRRGLFMRNAYLCGLDETRMMDMKVAELRQKLETGVSSGRSYFWWALLSLALVVLPTLLGLFVLWLVFV